MQNGTFQAHERPTPVPPGCGPLHHQSRVNSKQGAFLMEQRLNNLERQLASAQRQVRILISLAVLAPGLVAAAITLLPRPVAAQAEAPKKERTVLKAPFD